MLVCQALASDDSCVLWNADQVLSILSKSACVKAVFSGHCHGAPADLSIHHCTAPFLIMRARHPHLVTARANCEFRAHSHPKNDALIIFLPRPGAQQRGATFRMRWACIMWASCRRSRSRTLRGRIASCTCAETGWYWLGGGGSARCRR
jgi:hypothetical protein